MAITPKQAKEKARQPIRDSKRLEAIIDKAIIGFLKNGESVAYIGTSIFPNVETEKYLVQQYRNAGWDVTYDRNNKDAEEFLFFKEKKTRSSKDSNYGTLRPIETL